MALEARGLGYVYDAGTRFARRALEGVSLDVRPGGLALVVGPTGSGKSTLLRLCSTLLAPTEGSLIIDGSPVTIGPAREMRGKVGIVFQDPAVQLFAETVEADVAFGPRNLGASDAEASSRARDALSLVGLDPEAFAQRSPFTLSGGEARRVAIAGVLAMRPSYLLLDEPTAGLDARGRAAVLGIVERATFDAGVVVVTHDAEEFLPLAASVLVLADGCPVFLGGVGELVDNLDTLEGVGLRAPEVLRAQLLSERHVPMPRPLTLDPVEAARRVAAAGGWTR